MKDEERFEWDAAKAENNRKKHGVSFEEAQDLWDDSDCYCMKLCDYPESRWIYVGRAGRGFKRRCLTAIVTYRGEAIRIISARVSSKMEVERYYEQNHKRRN